MSKTALITGGTGFLGSNLAASLVDKGWSVHITTRDQRQSVPSGITLHVCDTANLVQAKRIVDEVKPNFVYHFAGSVTARPELTLADITFHSHVTSAHNLLLVASDTSVERLILCGSMMEMLDEVPSSPYAAAKAVTRLYGQMFHYLWDTPVVVARPFMTFGPGQKDDKVLPYVIRSLNDGNCPELGDASWRAVWIYVDDVVEAFYKAAVTPGIEGAVLDFGRGELVSLKHMVENIVLLMNSELQVRFGARKDRPNEPVRVADLAATRAKLDWTPIVSIEDGLARTIASYVKRASV